MSESANDMPSTSVALTDKASTPAKSERVPRLSAKLKRSLDGMVWDCLTDNEAAVQNGLTVSAIRIALKQPHVRAYYRGQLEVLRARESSRNIHTLIDVRDQKTNQMARVQAVKALELIDESETGSRAANQLPGLQIIIQQGVSAPPTIDVTPTPIDTRLTHGGDK